MAMMPHNMGGMVKIKGMAQVRANLKKYTIDQSIKYLTRMYAAGLYLQRMSQKIVPAFLGVLRGSAFTRRFGVGFKSDVIVGYTAKYAVYVHEDMDKRHGAAYNAYYASQIAGAKGKTGSKAKRRQWKNRKPNDQAKFLEKPYRENRGVLLSIIAGKMAVPE